ncbi:kinase-like domain-containing protein [Phellopilus nigrolimitatus]|nr:kinase-like domain-containing protein [Phellopilus nigrolimitatus]
MGLIHGDIKGCNILIDENKDPILTDFGLMLRTLLQSPSATPMSITASSNASSSGSLAGDYTLRFASKERVFDGMRTEEDEIWAIGMTLIELLTGEPPFSARYKNDLLFFSALTRVQIELERSDLPASVPDDLFQAIKRCISSKIAGTPICLRALHYHGKGGWEPRIGRSNERGVLLTSSGFYGLIIIQVPV